MLATGPLLAVFPVAASADHTLTLEPYLLYGAAFVIAVLIGIAVRLRLEAASAERLLSTSLATATTPAKASAPYRMMARTTDASCAESFPAPGLLLLPRSREPLGQPRAGRRRNQGARNDNEVDARVAHGHRPGTRGQRRPRDIPRLLSGSPSDRVRLSLAPLRRVSGLAEDLTQETFLAAVSELRRGRRVEHPLAWVGGIARHKLIDHYRRRERAERLFSAGDVEPLEAPAEGAEAVRERTIAALARVPAAQRAALVLRHLDGFTVPEVAGALGRSIEAVESLLVRGRASFKRAYLEVEG